MSFTLHTIQKMEFFMALIIWTDEWKKLSYNTDVARNGRARR
jgi:hypothetical protein